MPKDYKNRAQPRRAQRPTPGWVWLLAGFVLGGVSVGLVWREVAPGADQGAWIGVQPAPAQRPAAPRTAQREAVAPPRPKFDFYTLLPSEVTEVVVPDEELEPEPPKLPAAPVETRTAPAAPAPAVAVPAPAAARYLLQIASFRKGADADRLKAQLALLGYDANIQTVPAGGGGTWHRVRVGPFVGTGPLQQARERLASNGHKGMVIRVRP